MDGWTSRCSAESTRRKPRSSARSQLSHLESGAHPVAVGGVPGGGQAHRGECQAESRGRRGGDGDHPQRPRRPACCPTRTPSGTPMTVARLDPAPTIASERARRSGGGSAPTTTDDHRRLGRPDPPAIMAVMHRGPEPFDCSASTWCANLGLTPPTVSLHFRTVRESGLTRTVVDGRTRTVRVREEDVESAFPASSMPSRAKRFPQRGDRRSPLSRRRTVTAPA
jgi:DNA-binding transcriptional ArsR family regulator